MSALYLGRYRKRFEKIFPILKRENVRSALELCFGDTLIGEYCKRSGIEWTGYDLNDAFVENARKLGHHAIKKDVLGDEPFPKVDCTIMVGSLYHFHGSFDAVFDKVFQTSRIFILSEPIRNLSQMPWPISLLSQKMTQVGKGEETFRFNRDSLMEEISRQAARKSLEFEQIKNGRDHIVILKGERS